MMIRYKKLFICLWLFGIYFNNKGSEFLTERTNPLDYLYVTGENYNQLSFSAKTFIHLVPPSKWYLSGQEQKSHLQLYESLAQYWERHQSEIISYFENPDTLNFTWDNKIRTFFTYLFTNKIIQNKQLVWILGLTYPQQPKYIWNDLQSLETLQKNNISFPKIIDDILKNVRKDITYNVNPTDDLGMENTNYPFSIQDMPESAKSLYNLIPSKERSTEKFASINALYLHYKDKAPINSDPQKYQESLLQGAYYSQLLTNPKLEEKLLSIDKPYIRYNLNDEFLGQFKDENKNYTNTIGRILEKFRQYPPSKTLNYRNLPPLKQKELNYKPPLVLVSPRGFQNIMARLRSLKDNWKNRLQDTWEDIWNKFFLKIPLFKRHL